MLSAEHPNSSAVHQRCEQQRPATSSLSDAQDVDVVRVKSMVGQVEMKVVGDDMIIIEQKNELSFGGVDRSVSPDTHADVVLIQINDSAVFCRFGVFGRKPQIGSSVINNDDLGVLEMPAQGFNQSLTRPGTMDRLDAEGNVLR